MTDKFHLWLNVKINDRTLAQKLKTMCEKDKRTRSDFVRLLIEKEFETRSILAKTELAKNSGMSGQVEQGGISQDGAS